MVLLSLMIQALVDVVKDSDCGGEHLAIEIIHKASLRVESIACENIVTSILDPRFSVLDRAMLRPLYPEIVWRL